VLSMSAKPTIDIMAQWEFRSVGSRAAPCGLWRRVVHISYKLANAMVLQPSPEAFTHLCILFRTDSLWVVAIRFRVQCYAQTKYFFAYAT